MPRRTRTLGTTGFAVACVVTVLVCEPGSAGAVRASGPADAAGPHRVLRAVTCDGAWQQVPAPSPPDSGLAGASAVSPGDAWAVGYAGASALALHWDGSTWTESPVPQVGRVDDLTAVAMRSTHDAWAVGWFQRSSASAPRTLTYHWDGTSWSYRRSPDVGSSQDQLFGVTTGRAGTWAVGWGLSADGFVTEVQHLVGSKWQIVSSPNRGTGSNFLTGAATASPTDVLASGVADVGGGSSGYVAEWDGSSWKIPPSTIGPGVSFNAVAAGRGGRALAAGDGGARPKPFAEVRSRTGVWHGSRILVPKGEQGNLWGATWWGKNQALLVGQVGPRSGARSSTLIVGWDGSRWTIENSPSPGSGYNQLFGTASTAGVSWAVGDAGSRRRQGTLVEENCPTTDTAGR